MMNGVPIWTDAGLMFSFVFIFFVLVLSVIKISYEAWKELNKG